MGTLNYAEWTIEFDDRLLTHLQIVIVNRFRRGDSFLMSWIHAKSVGSGRSSIWLSPSIPAYFTFNGSRVPSIDQEWLQRLESSARSSAGLIVTDEHDSPVRVETLRAPHHPPSITRPAPGR